MVEFDCLTRLPKETDPEVENEFKNASRIGRKVQNSLKVKRALNI